MSAFDTTQVGKVDDTVRLQLGNQDVMVCESYDVHVGVLQQPASFTLRMGKGDTIASLIAQTPPRTPFQLFIGEVPSFAGFTDGFEAEGDTGATELTIEGRDNSAELHVGEFSSEVSYSNLTYRDLAVEMLKLIGFDPTPGSGNCALFGDNASSRQIRAGVGVVSVTEPTPDDDVIGGGGEPSPNTVIRAKVNEKYYRFMRRHFDRAGIMFWAGAQGAEGAAAASAGLPSFCIAIPNGDQKASYSFIRQRGLPSNLVNILKAKWRNNTVGRFSSIEVHSRSGGKAGGHAKFSGTYDDVEMSATFGYVLPDGSPLRYHAYRDKNCTSTEQCETYAVRKDCEARRAGWSLTYTIAGHTAPSLQDGGARCVITPDTVAHVEDDELGLSGDFYVESVRYGRSGAGTTTTVRLMRLIDLVGFGSQDE